VFWKFVKTSENFLASHLTIELVNWEGLLRFLERKIKSSKYAFIIHKSPKDGQRE